MDRDRGLKRRNFFKLCASAAALVAASPELLAQPGARPRRYQRARLVDDSNRPLRVADLEPGESYLFHYPFVATPCFLINLGRPAAAEATLATEDGRTYTWQGGVGPGKSVVAYSAICAHKMTHPAKTVSFINYRHKPVNFLDRENNEIRRDGVIYCCSEKSVYDPLQGAKVLGGPAQQPLAAILLEYDRENDALDAVGTYGGEMFDRFFREFGFRLQLEYKVDDVRRQVDRTTAVVKTSEYCNTQILCG